jgi:hypothetical protein
VEQQLAVEDEGYRYRQRAEEEYTKHPMETGFSPSHRAKDATCRVHFHAS